MKAQMPPSTATLTDNASNSVMASPKNSLLRGAALTCNGLFLRFRKRVPVQTLT